MSTGRSALGKCFTAVSDTADLISTGVSALNLKVQQLHATQELRLKYHKATCEAEIREEARAKLAAIASERKRIGKAEYEAASKELDELLK